MEQCYDVTAFGEVLIDFIYSGETGDKKKRYEENVGGAPANCAAAVAKLGGKAAFIGMTGQDQFGEDIRTVLTSLSVDIRGMRSTEHQHTTLAFVHLDQNGERHFSFCRNPGADTQLRPEDLDSAVLQHSRILHVGSLSLTDEPIKSATLAAIEMAKAAKGLISYDPNWRASLWKGRHDALALMKSLLPFADIVKISDEECPVLFGPSASYADAAQSILQSGATLALITLGAEGVYYATPQYSGRIAAPAVTVTDTTGAGDSFMGGLLYRITRRQEMLQCNQATLEQDLSFANAVASLCVTKRGAIPALPSLADVTAFMQMHNL
ncbi:MAG: carbohydrate kinase family protein [Treponema sp.]